MTIPPPDRRARLDFTPGSEIPVIRQPFEPGDILPCRAHGEEGITGQQHLYDLDVGPDERENRSTESVAHEMTELLQTALAEVDAPVEQMERLGLALDGSHRPVGVPLPLGV